MLLVVGGGFAAFLFNFIALALLGIIFKLDSLALILISTPLLSGMIVACTIVILNSIDTLKATILKENEKGQN